MEAADIATTIERCTSPALTRPVAAIMRQASGYEPLLVTIAGKRPIRILAESKPEAIALASEAAVVGQGVRVGLAQLDAGELKEAGLTIAAAFDPCEHIAGVGRVFKTRKDRLLDRGVDPRPAAEKTIASFKFAQTDKPAPALTNPDSPAETNDPTSRPDEVASAKDPPSWNVYRAQRGSSLLIYSR
jgi:type IV secretion system protein VirB1